MAERALLVDARAPYGSGLGRYLREIVRAMLVQRAFPEIVLAGDAHALAPFARELEGPVRVVPLHGGRYHWRVPFEWESIARAVGVPHVSWFPHWDGAWSAAPMAMTFHDLIALDGSGPHALARRVISRAWMARMVQGSGAILTASRHSAAMITASFPEAASKLRIVPHGVSERFFAAGADSAARAGAGVHLGANAGAAAPYLLTVANKRPHKRLEVAIRAFALLAREDQALRLVMVGERFAHADVLHALARSLGVADRVDDEIGLTDERLAQRYAGAEALLVPSRDEGFGMVALESMACGTPVVAVDRAPLPEVLGTAGVLVPFDDPAAMAQAVRRLRTDAVYRAERVAGGHLHVAPFTWTRAAASTAEILRGL